MAREKCIISIPPPQTPALCFFPKETHLSLTSHVCFIPVYYTPNQYKSTTWTFSNWWIQRKMYGVVFSLVVLFSLSNQKLSHVKKTLFAAQIIASLRRISCLKLLNVCSCSIGG
uniref:Uncharacterized protein n=1 Tax=Cacopsylla melanoneura TaxID=428564 RepID=A0A8D8LJJ2_9HEMI